MVKMHHIITYDVTDGNTLQCVVVLFVLCYVYAIVDTNDVI